MITQEKIDEWIREVDERPSSSSILIRFVANRLKHLAQRNEELLAENIQLTTGARVEAYEAQITSLQYQLDLLRRQLANGATFEGAPAAALSESLNIILYTSRGHVLRVELEPAGLQAGAIAAAFGAPADVADLPELGMLVAGSQEELLFVFDSGRTSTAPVRALPAARGALTWEQAHLEEPRGTETLAAIAPIGRMALAELCVQTSRRGCVKKMQRSGLESYVGKNYIGSGVKLPKDRSFNLLLCGKSEVVALVSREGYALALDTDRIPYTVEESLRLGVTDYVAVSFLVGRKPTLVFLTQNGKVLSREAGWLKKPPDGTLKARGLAVFSEERRGAGVRVVGAAAVNEEDWLTTLDSAGRFKLHRVKDLLGAGAALNAAEAKELRLLALATFTPPAEA